MNKNVLLLANGKGTRFRNMFPKTPKPLILYKRKPLIRWAYESIIKSELADKSLITVISNNQSVLNYAFDNLMCNIKYIAPTNSPAETLLSSKVIWKEWTDFYTVDCDVKFNFKFKDISSNYILPTALSTNPAYSYVAIENNYIKSIVEKRVISENAVIGVYPFKSKLINRYFSEHRLNSIEDNQEVYLSNLLQYQIDNGLRILPIICEEFKPLGIPEDLQDL